jgi:phosphoserine phosphatase
MVMAILRAVVLTRRFSGPIEELVRRSDEIGRGNLDPVPEVPSKLTEIRHLAGAQDRMRVALRSLLKWERDIQLAREIQQATFPVSLPQPAGFEIAAWSEPAEETGGDTYDVIGVKRPAPDASPILVGDDVDEVVMLLGDATGHGIGPALSATQIRSMLRMAVRMGGDIAVIARHINEQLVADLPAGLFVTAWLAQLRVADRSLSAFAAGQGPIIRYAAAQDRFDVQHRADAPPFGLQNNLQVTIPAPIQLQPGDLVAVFSDGIFEAFDAHGTVFELDRVLQVSHGARQQTASGILAAVRSAVAEFSAGVPATDDQTGIIVKCVTGFTSGG